MKFARSLHICLGHSWSSKERSAIKDALIARDAGLVPMIMCFEDSYIDRHAMLEGIDVYHVADNRFSCFWRLIRIGRMIKKFSFVIVHCYNLKFLTTISLALIRYPRVALMYTAARVQKKKITTPFLNRINSCFVHFDDIRDSISRNLGIHDRAIHTTGAGLSVEMLPAVEKHRYSVGIDILPHMTTFTELEMLITAANVFKAQGISDFQVVINFEDKNNEELLDEVKKQIIAWGLADNFVLLSGLTMSELVQRVEVWIELGDDPQLEDGMFTALFCGVPVIVPRSSVTEVFFEKYAGIGLDYRYHDVREFKQKLQHIFSYLGLYKTVIEHASGPIAVEQGIDRYRDVVIGEYTKFI